MKRRKLYELNTDEDLEKEGKRKDYERKQKVLDTANRVAQFLIILVPCLAIFLFLILCIHDIFMGNWNNIANYLSLLVTGGIGYLFGYLEKSGLKPKK